MTQKPREGSGHGVQEELKWFDVLRQWVDFFMWAVFELPDSPTVRYEWFVKEFPDDTTEEKKQAWIEREFPEHAGGQPEAFSGTSSMVTRRSASFLHDYWQTPPDPIFHVTELFFEDGKLCEIPAEKFWIWVVGEIRYWTGRICRWERGLSRIPAWYESRDLWPKGSDLQGLHADYLRKRGMVLAEYGQLVKELNVPPPVTTFPDPVPPPSNLRQQATPAGRAQADRQIDEGGKEAKKRVRLPVKALEAAKLKQEHPDWYDKKIAGEVGCTPEYLSRSTVYRKAKALAVEDRRARRGDGDNLTKDKLPTGGGRRKSKPVTPDREDD